MHLSFEMTNVGDIPPTADSALGAALFPSPFADGVMHITSFFSIS